MSLYYVRLERSELKLEYYAIEAENSDDAIYAAMNGNLDPVDVEVLENDVEVRGVVRDD